MSLSLCSFGRSFLLPVSSSRRPSLRLVVRAFLAARRRWPSGRLSVSLGSVRWLVDGSCGLLLSWDTDRFFLVRLFDWFSDPFFPRPSFFEAVRLLPQAVRECWRR